MGSGSGIGAARRRHEDCMIVTRCHCRDEIFPDVQICEVVGAVPQDIDAMDRESN